MSTHNCVVCEDGCKDIELPGLIGHQTVLMYPVGEKWITEGYTEDVEEEVLKKRANEIKKEFGVDVMVSRHDPVFDWSTTKR